MKTFTMRAFGDWGLFTMPETKVERLSYPVPTPSAIRGLLDSIYCKPKEFRHQVESIKVIKPIKFMSLKRNEVKGVATTPNKILYADATDDITRGRTQRQSMILKDIEYVIKFHLHPWPGFKSQPIEEQMLSRLKSGQHFSMPYFGCREFVAYCELLEEDIKPETNINLDLGMMLYDVFNLSCPFESLSDSAKSISPSFFLATVKDNVLTVPPYESPLVFKQQNGGK